MVNDIIHPSHNFVAIDVEYADTKQNICQIGIAIVNNLEIVGHHSWLIQPPGNHYEDRMVSVHHITPKDTENARTFEELWPEIQPYMLSGELWAHNAICVEQPVIEKNLLMHGFNADFLSIHDSRNLYQRPDCPTGKGNGLEQCCMSLNIPCVNHHDAEADAIMCAEIIIAYCNGLQPKWEGVPKDSEELRKYQQEKRILHLGEFIDFYSCNPSGDVDVLTELASTCVCASPQILDVFDKGDRLPSENTGLVDYTRLDQSESNPLRGKKVVLTGVFGIKRDEIKRAIETMGAKKASSISCKTDAVIIGTRNVGFTKLCEIEKQEASGHHIARIVGDTDLEALLYGDGYKFFS